jgi:tRNA A37 threonylcarbamoyltransferase TsaD
LCLLVSGGKFADILVRDYLDMEVIGQTIDDAAGEAFDKCAKVMGLPYPADLMLIGWLNRATRKNLFLPNHVSRFKLQF